jgi:hypothetical protein
MTNPDDDRTQAIIATLAFAALVIACAALVVAILR